MTAYSCPGVVAVVPSRSCSTVGALYGPSEPLGDQLRHPNDRQWLGWGCQRSDSFHRRDGQGADLGRVGECREAREARDPCPLWHGSL
jgi:hypothetical protein